MEVSSILPQVPLDVWQNEILWVLILGFVVAFFLAFGVGANDVANQFGTSVGAKVISLRNACILATVFELLGAVLIGARVSDTIRKKIIDLEVYEDSRDDYMLGNLAALGGSAIWLIVATFLNMPISGTHSIVGAVLGFSLVAKGFDGISWWELGKIVLSWFVSPVLSGFVSGTIFYTINRWIIKTRNPIKRGLMSLPIFYGLTVLINIASILVDGPDFLQIKTALPDWTEPTFGAVIAIVTGLSVAIGVGVWMVPYLRKRIHEELGELKSNIPRKSSIFVIGDSNSNVMMTDSPESQTPITISEDIHNKDGSQMRANTFGFVPELNHNTTYDVEKGVNDKNAGMNNLDAASLLPTTTTPEIIIIDGITPNNSGTLLIPNSNSSDKSNDTTNGYNYEKTGGGANSSDDGITFNNNGKEGEDDPPGVGRLFSFLQIMTAAFGSFAHGGNDVSNAIGPLIALYLCFDEGVVDTQAGTPIWLLIFGGVGISIGLWVWGRRVIKTMGEDLTKITPSSGFTIEIGAAITVLLASKIGVPVSTTHCKVGSVVFVGWIRTAEGGVDWSLFRNIVFAWLVTLPISAGLSALLMWILRSVY